MGLSARYLRIPRPETFLFAMSLQTGASLITLSLMLNKISGLYGLLALLTGYHLSPVQLSMYLYSLIALAITVLLFPHIRKQSPLQCLALAWLYVIDSVINATYTAAFGVTWFLVIAQHSDNGKASGPGSDTMGQTAGFTGSEYDTAEMTARGYRNGRNTDKLGNAVTQPESFESILFICALWTIRSYFVFVMLAFARQTLRLYIAMPRHTQLPTHSRATSVASMASVADIDREPFSPYSPDGQGWKGKMGRLMISVGRNYWLREEDDGNLLNMGQRFQARGAAPELPGPLERERRRRSGTGPPAPSQSAVQAAALFQQTRAPTPNLNVKGHDWAEPR
ncbi:Inositolphosphorylceramide synthase subunit Kei1-domain-containing protein [Aspergillus cavernicola]|uniref:Inositolphosphorylceramide synthase subunit Kei1-domain-containing protein n=1 Tax=Aspergillus cavernicola TaxID=176166 RepID=A0ABR4HRT6_9EURO